MPELGAVSTGIADTQEAKARNRGSGTLDEETAAWKTARTAESQRNAVVGSRMCFFLA